MPIISTGITSYRLTHARDKCARHIDRDLTTPRGSRRATAASTPRFQRMMECMLDTRVDVELLVVPDCPNAQPVRDMLLSRLRAVGRESTPIRVSVIDSQHAAERRGFVGSPTILINGRDPFAEASRPPALACRGYPNPTGRIGPAGLPPSEQLRAALAAAAATSPTPETL